MMISVDTIAQLLDIAKEDVAFDSILIFLIEQPVQSELMSQIIMFCIVSIQLMHMIYASSKLYVQSCYKPDSSRKAGFTIFLTGV